MSDTNGNGTPRIPAWAWQIAAPLLVATLLALGGWIWTVQGVNAEQSSNIRLHEARLDWHDREHEESEAWRARMEDKLDRIYQAVRNP